MTAPMSPRTGDTALVSRSVRHRAPPSYVEFSSPKPFMRPISQLQPNQDSFKYLHLVPQTRFTDYHPSFVCFLIPKPRPRTLRPGFMQWALRRAFRGARVVPILAPPTPAPTTSASFATFLRTPTPHVSPRSDRCVNPILALVGLSSVTLGASTWVASARSDTGPGTGPSGGNMSTSHDRDVVPSSPSPSPSSSDSTKATSQATAASAPRLSPAAQSALQSSAFLRQLTAKPGVAVIDSATIFEDSPAFTPHDHVFEAFKVRVQRSPRGSRRWGIRFRKRKESRW